VLGVQEEEVEGVKPLVPVVGQARYGNGAVIGSRLNV
jgi:hypothetical protein